MPDKPSLTLVKQFTYRGAPEQWSNTYHFDNGTPPNGAAWKILADAWWDEERELLDSSVKIYAAYGYEAGNEVSVWQYHYFDAPLEMTAGTLTGDHDVPGDCAVWVRWKTPDNNSKGRPIYLRKYFHGVTGQDGDAVTSTFLDRADDYATHMKDESLPGGLVYCGPQGAEAGAHQVSAFFTTRTLKRRGRRP